MSSKAEQSRHGKLLRPWRCHEASDGSGSRLDARELDTAMTTFNSALETLSPVASGAPVEPAVLRDLVDAERSAVEHLWNLTTQIGEHLSQGVTAKQSTEATRSRQPRLLALRDPPPASPS